MGSGKWIKQIFLKGPSFYKTKSILQVYFIARISTISEWSGVHNKLRNKDTHINKRDALYHEAPKCQNVRAQNKIFSRLSVIGIG